MQSAGQTGLPLQRLAQAFRCGRASLQVVAERGRYRVPSLRGVAARRLLLHDGSVRGGLDELFDPARLAPGHAFGLDLDAPARDDLLAYLRGL